MSIIQVHPEMSYDTYLEQWMKWKENKIQNSTLLRYKNRIDTYISKGIGDFGLEEIDNDVILDFIEDLKSRIPNQPNTIRDIYNVVHGSLEEAVRKSIIPENPADGVVLPKIEHGEIVFWDEQMVDEFLGFLRENPKFLAFYLIVKEGFMQGEALALSWNDIDLERGTITVSKTLSRDGKEILDKASINDVRESSFRTINISEESVFVLNNIKRDILKLGAINPFNLVVCTSKGTPVIPRNLLRIHYQVCEKLGFPRNSFQDLRHIFILSSLKKGVSPMVLTEKLGFSDMRYLKVYKEHLSEEEKELINRDSAKHYGRRIFVADI